MIEIAIDSLPVEWEVLSCHFQRIPRPGGSFYSVKLGRDEIHIIDHIESMVKKRIDAPEFVMEAFEHQDSTFNLVMYVIWSLEKKYGRSTKKPIWVFNNIYEIVADEEFLIISGECSRYDESYFM